MLQVDTLVHAAWIIPVVPEGLVLTNHTLVIVDGRITEVLPTEAAMSRYHSDNTFSLTEHAVIPGLINAHTHAAMTLFRGLADDLALMTWLNAHIWPAEQKWVSPEFIRDGTRLAIAEMLLGGTTCFNDMYFFPDQTAAVVTEVGLRAVVGLIVIDFPTAWASNAQEYFTKAGRVHDDYLHHPLVTTAYAPHAPYTVNDAALARVVSLAEELELNVHMHIHETTHEVDSAMQAEGIRPLERLRRLHLLSPRLSAVHMTQLNSDEIAMAAEHNINVVHCPHSNLKLASGFAPIHELDRGGINVAIGTDGAASNNSLNMFAEMRMTALLAKAVSADPTAIPAARALSMATLHGARALGLDQQLGSLERGKCADFVAVDLSRPECQPIYDPISQLVYATDGDCVTDVWVAGKQLVHNRRLTTIDAHQLRHTARMWLQRVRTKDGAD